MSTAPNGKDVIYVDVDDEITDIIDKVTGTKAKVVAMVLPKRATVFQSIVNMKLLKRRADNIQKNLVLITSEAGILPLAGSVGLHVAATLQSKPEIPETVAFNDALEDVDEDAPLALPAEDFDASRDSNKPVGDLAKKSSDASKGKVSASQSPIAKQMAEETIELDNTDIPEGAADSVANVAAMAAGGSAGKSGGKGKKDKKLKIPNFEKFRLKLVFLALAVILLIAGWLVANSILPKAVITVKTDTSSINSTLTPTLDTGASAVNVSAQTVPAKTETLKKDYSQQVAATGKQNNGTKAAGSVTLSLADCSQDSVMVPAGTGLSVNGLTFITLSSVKLNSIKIGGNCRNADFPNISTGSTEVSAQQGGAQYNIAPSTFTVAGYSNITGSSSSGMTGGTDDITTVVQQTDLDGAKQKVEASIDKGVIKTQLQQKLENDGEYAVIASFTASAPEITSSANVGDKVDNITYTESVTYTMFGAKKVDLRQIVEASVNKQIDTSKQAIQDDGIDKANITVPTAGSGSKVQISVELTSVVGPHLDAARLKESVVGKKSGDVQSIIKSNPGVKDVSVSFSPFWVNHVPKNTGKTTIVFEKSSSNASQ